MTSKASDQTLEGGARAGGADGSLGEQLRRTREARGVSLREISEQTRITMRHLEAIEADDYKHLPGGIFNKSFIKAYARQINFDEKRALDLYARTLRERGETEEDAATSPRRSQVYTDGDTSRSPLVTALLSALILGITVLVVYAGYHWYQRRESGAPATPAAPTNTAAQPTPQAGAPTPAAAAPLDSFNIQARAKDKPFWLTWRKDAEKQGGRILMPGAEPQAFTPENSLYLKFDSTSASALEVTLNGQPLRPPVDERAASGESAPPKKEIEWTITKENYRQFLP
ncbi:MAG TPA: helix-turn-helix domain-containing protein [Pyrinomonadaceae bacterium]|nr:helix-turn-helix domain-containing protein [Pyrinomonadaceae bacterium]